MATKRVSLTEAMALIAVLSVASALLFSTPGRRHTQTFRRLEAAIDFLRHRAPADIPAQVWEPASMWTGNACLDVCSAPESIRLDEFQRFTAEVESKVQGDVGLDTLDWMWDRLERTGSRGRRYVERHRILYEQEVRSIRNRPSRTVAG